MKHYPAPPGRATLFKFLRLAAALLIVIWLASRAGWDAVLEHFTRIDISLLGAALALMFAAGTVKAWNWRRLIQSTIADCRVSFSAVMSWYFAGGFLGAVVPSSASTDMLRAFLGQRALGGHGAAFVASVLTLNAVGWVAGALLGLIGIGLLAIGNRFPPMLGPAVPLFLIMAVALPAAYVVLSSKRARILDWLQHFRWPKVIKILRKFLDAVCVFERAHVRFVEFLIITAASVGVYVPFAVWMVLTPLTRIVALVPISVADFGLIQGAHIWVLSEFGVTPSLGFVISTLYALQGLVIHATIGSAAFVYGGRRGVEPGAVTAR
jgi:glycosyltransferase 2 family protein